jgi:hypothetical protein
MKPLSIFDIKHTCILCLLFWGLHSFTWAQFNRGDFFIGGSLQVEQNASRSSVGEPSLYRKDASIGFAPLYGIFLNPRWALGLTSGYALSLRNLYQENQYPEKRRSHIVSPGVFARRYLPLIKPLWFVLKGQINYDFISIREQRFWLNQERINNFQHQSVNAGLVPLFLVFASPMLAFEVSPGALSYRLIFSENRNSHQVNLAWGGLQVGLNYYFRKKESEELNR